MKQTATDYLYECFIELFRQYTEDEIDGGKFGELITEAHQQAKAMEKQHIIETYNEGALDGLKLGETYNEGALDGLQLGEQYYNHVFNQ